MPNHRHGDPPRTTASASASLAVSTYLVRATITAIGAIVGVLLARALGPQGRGDVAFVASVYYVGLLVLNLGYENALLHRQAERGVAPATLRRLGGVLALVSGCAGLLLVAGLSWLLHGSVFSDIRVIWLAVGVGPLPFALDLIYLRAIFQANNRLHLVNRTALGGALVQVAVVLGAFVAHRLSVATALAAAALAVLVPWVVLRVRARAFGPARLDRPLILGAVSFGLKSSFGITFLYLMYRFDFLVVKVVLGTSALGQYSVATSVAEILWLVTDSLALALISRQMVGTFTQSLDLTVRTLRKAFVALPAAGVGIAICGGYFIPVIFGSAFRASVGPMLILLPGVFAIGAVKPVTLLIIRSNRPGILSLMSLAGFALNMVLLFPLALHQGIAGAALASTVAYSLVAVIYLGWLAKAGVRLADLIPRGDDVRWTARVLSPRHVLASLRLLFRPAQARE